MSTSAIPSGIQALDEVLQGIRLDDNVVWQVDRLEDYRYFARPFAEAPISARRRLVYLRFASHLPVLEPHPEMEKIELAPSLGFDYFTREVHHVAKQSVFCTKGLRRSFKKLVFGDRRPPTKPSGNWFILIQEVQTLSPGRMYFTPSDGPIV